MLALKSAPTPLDHFSAAASMGILSLLMVDLAWMSTNAWEVHITASKTASTSTEDFYAAATQATNSTLTEGLALVSHANMQKLSYETERESPDLKNDASNRIPYGIMFFFNFIARC